MHVQAHINKKPTEQVDLKDTEQWTSVIIFTIVIFLKYL